LRQLVALGILVGLGALLYIAWRRRRLAVAFIAVTVVMALLWALAYTAISKDYRDADGWVDCWPRCSAFQNAVGGTFILGPAAFVVLGIFAAILGAITALNGRERESPPRG
jgi:hypothetical protein